MHRNSDHVPVLACDKQFIILVNGLDRDSKPVSQTRDDCDDSFSAAPCDPVFIEFGPLPVPVLSQGQERSALLYNLHIHHIIVSRKTDAPDATCSPAHAANIRSMEPDRLCVSGADYDVVGIVDLPHRDQFVVLIQLERNDPALSGAAEL